MNTTTPQLEDTYCDMCQKVIKGQLFEEGYGNLVCAKCDKIAQKANYYREIQDRKMDEEAFSLMNADEQAYQVSLGYGRY